MIVDHEGLTEALAHLELEGGDCLDIEAKTFGEYSADAIGPTLSAFANLPGGGTILLGVSENPVEVVGVDKPEAMKKALTSQARKGFSTAISVDTHTIRLGDRAVVVANVAEVPVNVKPCRWTRTRAAYLRQYDGDYRMSLQEEQQLLMRHERPRNDSVDVPGTSAADLNQDLTARFLRAARAGSTALRNETDEDVLSRLNVVTEAGTLTLAGLYALGDYPQKHFPGLSITAAVTLDGEERARNRLSITGSVPQMLHEAVEWVERVTTSTIRFSPDGHGRDSHEYPLVAVRELVANALIHRDLSEPALSKSIEIRLLPDRLIISSPGGLWGLSVDQLGTRDGKSAVNEYLYTIATFASDEEGRRMIEGLGTGIRAAKNALREADLEPVRFLDTGVRFTCLLPRAALLPPGDLQWLSDLNVPTAPPPANPNPDDVPEEIRAVTSHAATMWQALASGAETRPAIVEATGLSHRQVAYALNRLIDRGYVVASGGRGNKNTTYRQG